jgi:hypothetical protein
VKCRFAHGFSRAGSERPDAIIAGMEIATFETGRFFAHYEMSLAFLDEVTFDVE